MELLILKSGQAYIRCREDSYFLVKMDKASVFPMDQIKIVKAHETNLKKKGFEHICIKKLILTEEDL